MTEAYKPPLQNPITQAEAAIHNMVAAPGAEWSQAPYDWMVGGNAAKSKLANEYADVMVTQAIGPDPQNQPAVFTARTPFGSVKWTEGARHLGELRRRDGSPWTDLAIAQKAMGSIISAQVVEAPSPDPSVPRLPKYIHNTNQK